MSIDSNAVIVVGLPQSELDPDLLESAKDNGFPYYYNCYDDDMIMGFPLLLTENSQEIPTDILTSEETVEFSKTFFELFKKTPKIYLTLNVW